MKHHWEIQFRDGESPWRTISTFTNLAVAAVNYAHAQRRLNSALEDLACFDVKLDFDVQLLEVTDEA